MHRAATNGEALSRMLRAEPAQDLFHNVGAFDLFRRLRAGSEQGLDGGRVVSRSAVPAVFGAVDGPAERGGLEVAVSHLQRRMVAEDGSSHLRVAVETRSVQGRGIVLASSIHRQTCLQ